MVPGTPPALSSLTAMERFFLIILCTCVILLVTALALTTPALKTDGPAEKTILLREGR
jgi:hypothetical protein